MVKVPVNEVEAIFHSPLLPLISRAHSAHITHHEMGEVQVCQLISYKTGGCPEDCKYCSQSVRYPTSVVPLPLLQKQELLKQAQAAKARGVTRMCIGAAWREVRNGKAFDTILEVVKEITEMGVEVCCTLGMLTTEQANKLAQAGLYAYNHNLDSSESFYKTIITTRQYADRLATLKKVSSAQISTCCGGIVGLGESVEDRIQFLHTLANLEPSPESVPINFLIPIKGTPLEKQSKISIWEFVRVVATARILLPKAMIRITGHRGKRSLEEQALCFFAGANSIHVGRTFTQPGSDYHADKAMFQRLGLKERPPFKKKRAAHTEDPKGADRLCFQ